MKRWITPSLALLLASRALAMPFALIYGSDDRKDLYDVADPKVLALAKSTVALFPADLVAVSGQDAVIKSTTFDHVGAKKLDPGERFYGQPDGAFCSGVLIAPDVVLTAGHCFDERACTATKFVFDFGYDTKAGDPTKRKAADVYGCAKVLASEVGWKDKDAKRQSDWAVVKLDRAASGRTPLKLNRDPAKKKAAIMAIGHPYGLPTKVFGNAVIIDDTAVGMFGAHLDGGPGASGSPVFNVDTGLIEGILALGSRNTDDFEQLPTNCSYKGEDPFTRELTCPGDPIVVKSKVVDPTDTNAARATRLHTILTDIDSALKKQ